MRLFHALRTPKLSHPSVLLIHSHHQTSRGVERRHSDANNGMTFPTTTTEYDVVQATRIRDLSWTYRERRLEQRGLLSQQNVTWVWKHLRSGFDLGLLPEVGQNCE